ncbi:hypothetical protein GGS21DRAFT_492771 [Xylaria nigripes]|nr:hypothetical protein GGS21DRAFT_492771 [Xylaria nigripes]
MEQPCEKEFFPGYNHPDLSLTFQGQNTYVHYLKCQKDVTTWLVETVVALGVDVLECPPTMRGVELTHKKLSILAKIVADRGCVCQSALDSLDFMLKVRGEWKPIRTARDHKQKMKNQTEEADLRTYTEAIDALRTVRARLESGVIVPTEPHHDDSPCFDTDCDGCKLKSRPSQNTRHRTIYTLHALKDESCFAWVCFFNDLLVIRTYLRNYWYSYQQSLESLTIRALVTNTAIRLIRQNCEAQLKATAHLTDQPKNADVSHWIMSIIINSEQGQGDDPESESWKVFEANWACYEAMSGLLCLEIDKADYPEDSLVPVHRDRLRSIRYFSEWPGFFPHRFEVATTFVALAGNVIDNTKRLLRRPGGPPFFPCFDEITTACFEWLQQSPFTVPLWVVITVQIWIDIQATIHRYTKAACADLRAGASRLIELVRKGQTYECTRMSKITDGKNMPNFLELPQLYAKCLQADNYLKMCHAKNAETPMLPIYEPHSIVPEFFLLEHHPTLCGMQLWWAEQKYRGFENWAVKLHENIIPAALLYMSMQTADLVNERWSDMEYFLKIRFLDVMPYAQSHWGGLGNLPEYRDINMAFEKHFRDIYQPTTSTNPAEKPQQNGGAGLLGRFCDDLFQCYLPQDTSQCSPPVSSATLLKIVDNVYPNGSTREVVREGLCLGNNPNILRVLDLVTVALRADARMCCFDLFVFDRYCGMFLAALRDKFMGKFKKLYHELDNENTNSDSEQPFFGADIDPSALDALYYIMFPTVSHKRVANMIMASICVQPSDLAAYTLPDHAYVIDLLGSDMVRLIKKLDISLEYSASVFNEFNLSFGNKTSIESAARQRESYTPKENIPTKYVELHNAANRTRWYHACHWKDKPDECCDPLRYEKLLETLVNEKSEHSEGQETRDSSTLSQESQANENEKNTISETSADHERPETRAFQFPLPLLGWLPNQYVCPFDQPYWSGESGHFPLKEFPEECEYGSEQESPLEEGEYMYWQEHFPPDSDLELDDNEATILTSGQRETDGKNELGYSVDEEETRRLYYREDLSSGPRRTQSWPLPDEDSSLRDWFANADDPVLHIGWFGQPAPPDRPIVVHRSTDTDSLAEPSAINSRLASRARGLMYNLYPIS